MCGMIMNVHLIMVEEIEIVQVNDKRNKIFFSYCSINSGELLTKEEHPKMHDMPEIVDSFKRVQISLQERYIKYFYSINDVDDQCFALSSEQSQDKSVSSVFFDQRQAHLRHDVLEIVEFFKVHISLHQRHTKYNLNTFPSFISFLVHSLRLNLFSFYSSIRDGII